MREKRFNEDFKERCNRIWEEIKDAAYKVSNTLGVGFLEKVYENALAIELRRRGLRVQQQYPLRVMYEGEVAGEYTVDLMVEECVLVELKVAKALDNIHTAITLNYIKASPWWLIGLINFGKPRIDINRYVDG
jgi:GxxExxY protein